MNALRSLVRSLPLRPKDIAAVLVSLLFAVLVLGWSIQVLHGATIEMRAAEEGSRSA
jgi:hypothetical protein